MDKLPHDRAIDDQNAGAAGERKDWLRPTLLYFKATDAAMDPEPNHDGEEGFDFLS